MKNVEEEEKMNLFETFKSVVESAIEERKKVEKWAKKIYKNQLRAQITLQIGEDEYLPLKLILENGNLTFELGNLENYDIELIAEPEDLMWFSNKKYSTLTMLTKKNRYGYKKLRVKKGGRNIKKLLFLSKLLVFD